MELKNSYSSREVAAMTGLTARQLQWWDARRLFQPAVSPKRTAAGGFTERRYTPVDLLELIVLADLRKQGMSVARIRKLLDTLRTREATQRIPVIIHTSRILEEQERQRLGPDITILPKENLSRVTALTRLREALLKAAKECLSH